MSCVGANLKRYLENNYQVDGKGTAVVVSRVLCPGPSILHRKVSYYFVAVQNENVSSTRRTKNTIKSRGHFFVPK